MTTHSPSHKETSEYLFEILASIQDGITVLDAEGVHIDVNDAFCAMTGYSREELINSGLPHVYWPKDEYETIMATFNDMSLNRFKERELTFKRKNGELFPVLVYPSQMKNEAGEVIRYLATFKDISERKQAERALQQSEDRYRRFTELTSDFVYMCERGPDKPFRIQWLAGAFETITGYSQEELISKGCWLPLVVEDERERIANGLLRLRPGDNVTEVFRIRAKSGNIRWLQELCRCEAGGEPGHLVLYGSSQDITARKQAESDRKASESDRLDMERKLLHAQKLESLGTMAGGIAHDFNNLLAAILGNLDLALLHLPPGSPVQSYIQGSMNASRRAADLTRQMLAYSGKAIFNVQLVDINEIVSGNASLFRTVIQKNISFNVSTADDMPLIMADPGQIQQVVMNMITNAAEAIDTKQGVIILTTGHMECGTAYLQKSVLHEKPSPGSFVYVELSDNGCGMSEEANQRIFEPFFTTKFTGRGLGMAAAQGIVNSHKGAILLESTEGRGTTFRMLFPVAAGAAPHPEPKEQKPSADSIEIAQGKGVILVVDDEEDVRKVAGDYVRYLGFEVLEASNGTEAMAIFHRHANDISIVILDLIMPVMDGVDTFREMKAIKPDVHIILSSGYSELAVAEHFPNEKPDAFIQKPFRVSELQQKIDQVST